MFPTRPKLRIDQFRGGLDLSKKGKPESEPVADDNVVSLNLSEEGKSPRTGKPMQKAKLLGASIPQKVWYCPESRIALPMTDPDLL